MPVVRFITDGDGGGGGGYLLGLPDCAQCPCTLLSFPIASSGKWLGQGSGMQIEFGVLAFDEPGNLSLQRTFALVCARATGLLKLSCAIDPVRSYERRAVAANGDMLLPCWAFSTFYLLSTSGASQILDITRGSNKAWGVSSLARTKMHQKRKRDKVCQARPQQRQQRLMPTCHVVVICHQLTALRPHHMYVGTHRQQNLEPKLANRSSRFRRKKIPPCMLGLSAFD